jgi:hypothetical protein
VPHRVTPVARYLFTPRVAQDHLPLFDESDRIAARSLVEYGLRNRLYWLTNRFGEPGYVELDVMQHYSFRSRQEQALSPFLLFRCIVTRPQGEASIPSNSSIFPSLPVDRSRPAAVQAT